MSISFNQIPINMLTPGQYVEFDNGKANKGLVVMPNRILILAQMLSTGVAVPNQPFMATRLLDVQLMCGRGSHAAEIFQASQAVTDTVETWVLPLADNPAGVAATGSFAISGAPNEPGLLNVYIGDVLVQIAVAMTSTPNTIAANLAAVINANADLPVTATVSTATVTVAAKNKGAVGNDLQLQLNYHKLEQRTPGGLAVAVTAMANGAGDPAVGAALANLGETQYNTLLMGLNDSVTLALVEAELEARWGPLNQIDGRVHTAKRGTVGELNTFASTRNSPHVFTWSVEKDGSPSSSWKHAAVWGTICAFYLGGIDPARPVQTLVGRGLLPASPEKRFTRAERNNLLSYGLATYVADSGGNLMVERAVSMYTENAAGLADPSYRDAETMYTLSYLRYSVRARIAQKFPRYKLADDGTNIAPGQAIATPSVVRGELIALFRDWEEAGLVENFDQFKADLLVQRNNTDRNRVDVLLPPDLINQFRVFAAKLEFRL